MDQPITPELIEAINVLKSEKDISDYKLSEILKTTPASVSRWMNFKTDSIKSKYAKILMPMIKDIHDDILAKKELVGDKELPASLKNFITKLETLKNKDPQLLNHYCTMLEATLGFAQNVIPEQTGHRISSPAKLAIKKLSAKASKEKVKKVKEELYYEPMFQPEEVKAAAGTGCFYDYEYSVPAMGGRADIDVVSVIGNSMEPYISEGSKVIIQRFMEPLDFADLFIPEQAVKSLVPDGAIIIYNLNDSGLAIKKVRYESHGNNAQSEWSLYLEALNPAWAEENGFPRRITMQDRLVIFGKMIGEAE